MNRKQTLTAIRALGMTARYDVGSYEYQVDYARTDTRWSKDSTYFTSDGDDAVETARRMAGWKAPEARTGAHPECFIVVRGSLVKREYLNVQLARWEASPFAPTKFDTRTDAELTAAQHAEARVLRRRAQ